MRVKLAFGLLCAVGLLAVTGRAGAPNVKGKISGQDKLIPDVYAEIAKPESKRWTWREPSTSVDAKFRPLSAYPSRDVCIVATSSANQPPQEPIRMTVTGGRIVPTTIVVSPNTQLVFKNFDPFPHRLYGVGQRTFAAADMAPNATKGWSAPGPGKYEIRDELFPSVRTFVIVDPQVVASVFPGRDGAFGFSIPSGDYVIKAFFDGKQVGKPIQVAAKDKAIELKEPLNLGEDAR